MENRYVMLWNSGLYTDGDQNVFTLDQIRNQFIQTFGLSNDTEFVFSGSAEDLGREFGETAETLDELIDELLRAGEFGETIRVYENSLVEMGDDYVDVSIVQLS